MSTFLYNLPTTGAVSFSDFILDPGNNKLYTRHISEATQTRAKLRGTLKESKRTDGEKDYLSLVKILDEYLPQLRGVMGCLEHDEIGLKSEPVFSWRTTLSAHVFHSAPRISLPSLYAEYACCLLTYAFALSNLARTIVASLGAYEHDRAISQTEREAKDERLKHATSFLCRASGAFTYISETVLVEWEERITRDGLSLSKFTRPPDLSRDVVTALGRLSLADAQTLAIRKLLSRSFYDSNITPGPPLPKSHPPPGLIAKLHLECASLYSSARTLAKTPSASSNSSSDATREVSPELRHYLGDEAALHTALSKKWLGIDAGEKGGESRAGDAVGFMMLSRKELQELKDGGKNSAIGSITKGEREKRDRSLRKERVAEELESVNVWLKHYKKVNDTVHFQPVPSQSDLQARIPAGVSAVSLTGYVPPIPSFGPGSMEHTRRQAEELELVQAAPENGDPVQSPTLTKQKSYAGEGEYY